LGLVFNYLAITLSLHCLDFRAMFRVSPLSIVDSFKQSGFDFLKSVCKVTTGSSKLKYI